MRRRKRATGNALAGGGSGSFERPTVGTAYLQTEEVDEEELQGLSTVQGFKLMMDHDSDEERELNAIESREEAQRSDSSSEGDEEIAQDIIKFRKKQRRERERAIKKKIKDDARREKLHTQNVVGGWKKKFANEREKSMAEVSQRIEQRRIEEEALLPFVDPNETETEDEIPAFGAKADAKVKPVDMEKLDFESDGSLPSSLNSSPTKGQSGASIADLKKAKKARLQVPKGIFAIMNQGPTISLEDKLKEMKSRFLAQEKLIKKQKKEKRRVEKAVVLQKEEESEEEDEFLMDLLGDKAASKESKSKSSRLDRLLTSEEGSSDEEMKPSDPRLNDNGEYIPQTQQLRSSEEYMQYLQMKENLRVRNSFMVQRYDSKNRVDSFIRQILSLEIIDTYFNIDKSVFEKYTLPDNFGLTEAPSDPCIANTSNSMASYQFYGLPAQREYLEKWLFLFMYETYNVLMNSRRSDSKDADYELNLLKQQQILKAKEKKEEDGSDDEAAGLRELYAQKQAAPDAPARGRSKKIMYWEADLLPLKKETYFYIVKMYERKQADDKAPPAFQIRQIAEQDLLVLTEEKLDLGRGVNDIKKRANPAYLKQLLSKQNAMFAWVNKKQNPSRKTEGFSASLYIDISKSFFFDSWDAKESKKPGEMIRMHCYRFDNFATTVREFRCIRHVEFFKMAPIIFQPSMALLQKEQMIKAHIEMLQENKCMPIKVGSTCSPWRPPALENNDSSKPKTQPLQYAKNVMQVEDFEVKLKKYAHRNRKYFNPSQLIVLDKVIDMPKNDILLIQGPPGTGKTHTITGIISMLLSTKDVKKIMVCAPSNAAIDEIVYRISAKGFIGDPEDPDDLVNVLAPGQKADGMLLRIGAQEYEPSPEVKRHTLDERLMDQLNGNKAHDLKERIEYAKELLSDMEKAKLTTAIHKHVEYIRKILQRSHRGAKDFINKLGKEEQSRFLNQSIKSNQDKLREILCGDEKSKQGGDWKFVENQIILKSTIICCTLSLAAQEKLDLIKDSVDYLIVDEACQCIEPSTLIPFELGPSRIILVGDQNQLPATTFSDNSITTKFSRSIFERLLVSGYEKTMLTIQYRMHAQIREFPSNQFYDGAIDDYFGIATRKLPPTMVELESLIASRFVFFDITDSRETSEDKSKCNNDEAELTKQLIDFLAYNCSKTGSLAPLAGQIGVITPYKSQVRLIKNKVGDLCRRHGCQLQETVEVNTVDAFQGREKDVIIFNCVRSNLSQTLQGGIGFLMDDRRLNVAITRPRHYLFVIGNASTLEKSDVFKGMIDFAKQKAKYVRISKEILRAKGSHPVNLMNHLPPILQAPCATEGDESRSTQGQRSTKYSEDDTKNEIVKQLMKRARSDEEMTNVQNMLNETKYYDLKRRKVE